MNETKFCIHIIIDKIYVGIVMHHFLQICYSYGVDLHQNLDYAQYPENK